MRPKFITRRFRLVGKEQVESVRTVLANVPIDRDSPLEVVIQEERKVRSLDQNALMWSGPLQDIAQQAWVAGKSFSVEVWHEHFKREFLPDESIVVGEELAARVKNPAAWRKWDFTPSGERVLVGSTTQLTKFGFSEYLTQVEACGASMGVQFSVRMAA